MLAPTTRLPARAKSVVHPLVVCTAITLCASGALADIPLEQAYKNTRKALEAGVLKILSKIGISLLSSYHGAQIFEALGLHPDVVETCFSGTPSRIGGLSFVDLAEEVAEWHETAFRGEEEITRLDAENTRLSAGITAMQEELCDGIDNSREAEERAGPESAGVGGRVARRHMQRALNYRELLSYSNRLGETTAPHMCERCGLHPTCGMSVSYNGSWPPTHLCRPCYDAETTATDNEISNQRAAELTAARAEIARLQAENARLRAHAEQALNHGQAADAHALMAALLTEGEDDDITRLRERIGEVIGARGLAILSEAARYADMEARQAMAQATQSTDPEPFTGQGNRLGE